MSVPVVDQAKFTMRVRLESGSSTIASVFAVTSYNPIFRTSLAWPGAPRRSVFICTVSPR